MPPLPPAFDGVSCPQCLSHTGKLLEVVSKSSRQTFYQCERCEHIWTTDQPPAPGQPIKIEPNQ
jgi:uncharacterized Zn finger protein